MSEDRYAPVAHSLRRMGWLQDRILHRARVKVVDMVVKAGARTVLDACCGAGTLSRYLDFLASGGAHGWLTRMDAQFIDEAWYLFGNLGVFRLGVNRHRGNRGIPPPAP